jgi:uncharacterized glyoxalase superfamily protein PhnB
MAVSEGDDKRHEHRRTAADVAGAHRLPTEVDAAPSAGRERPARARPPASRVRQPFEAAPWGDEFGMLVDRFGIGWLVNIAGAAAS